MNVYKFLLTACFMSIISITSAQDKGYYSIGNNREKLKIGSDGKSPDSFMRVQKGYYDIVPNRRKLSRSLWDNAAQYRRVPAPTKGYYSIGNNSDKLSRN